jgi:D-alanyl-D-alanine carboxypeptidase
VCPTTAFVPIVEIYHGNRFRSWRPAELIKLIAGQPPDFTPGTAWSYSNTGYGLAGMIIERVTGNSLGRELERRIFRPLRLRDTSFPTDFPFLLGRHANGYSLRLDRELNPIDGPMFDITVYNPSLAWAAGNMVSTADDLARFFDALLSKGIREAFGPGAAASRRVGDEARQCLGHAVGVLRVQEMAGVGQVERLGVRQPGEE